MGSFLAELPFYEWETFALDQMWLFIPLQAAIKDFLTTIPQGIVNLTAEGRNETA